jgi:hypothetical protein
MSSKKDRNGHLQDAILRNAMQRRGLSRIQIEDGFHERGEEMSNHVQQKE